jgi:hypothetical protein
MIGVSFEPIIAPPFNEGILRLYVLNEMRKIATEIKRDFSRTVTTWNTKPKFSSHVGFGATQLKIEVTTEDENYARVSDGTAGKPRVARGFVGVTGARALTIIPYIPKTTPGSIDAKPGGAVEGAPVIFRRYALNAGKIRPRKFDDLVQAIWEEKLPDRLQQALDAAAVKTGFAF